MSTYAERGAELMRPITTIATATTVADDRIVAQLPTGTVTLRDTGGGSLCLEGSGLSDAMGDLFRYQRGQSYVTYFSFGGRGDNGLNGPAVCPASQHLRWLIASIAEMTRATEGCSS